MSGWYIDTIRVYVTGEEKSSKRIIARLQPVDGSTILQMFGYESPIHRIECKVVGEANLAALEALVDTDVAYTVSGYNFSKDLYISAIQSKRDESVYQTLDTSLACETPVYTVSLELYE
jgi:hypothetical protein